MTQNEFNAEMRKRIIKALDDGKADTATGLAQILNIAASAQDKRPISMPITFEYPAD